MGKLVDLTGRVFTRLVVIEKGPLNKYRASWICKCACGAKLTVLSSSLLSGNTKSCGCLKIEQQKIRGTTHGRSDERVYHIWENVVGRGTGRCHRKKYFDKGIGICKRWLKFEAFLEDMKEPPTTKHVIDRIDNSKGYSSDNCRWVAYKESIRNRLTSCKNGIRLITLNNKTQCMHDWCVDLDIKSATVYARIRRGWSEKDALLQPLKR